MKNLVAAALIFLLSNPAFSQAGTMLFSERGEVDQFDKRHEFGNKLLRLVLETTTDSFGPYQLAPTPGMSFERAIASLKSNRYDNFFYGTTYKQELIDSGELVFVPFPIVLGLLGYRVCFYPKRHHEKINKYLYMDDIHSLVHGQGRTWTDVTILRHNNIKVVEVGPYESLFKMAAAARFDLLCRGVNEVLGEYKRFSSLEGIAFDYSFAFHYELPVFYLANARNKKAIERVTTGLKRAYDNGSMMKLLHTHYGDSIKFVKLGSRKIFELENPSLKSLDASYQRYNINPQQLNE